MSRRWTSDLVKNYILTNHNSYQILNTNTVFLLVDRYRCWQTNSPTVKRKAQNTTLLEQPNNPIEQQYNNVNYTLEKNAGF